MTDSGQTLRFETLFLHVGLEKTGTTSIQRSMHTHRSRLEQSGYVYPRTFAVGRNTLLGAMFHPDPQKKPQFHALIEGRGGSQELFATDLQHELGAELAETTAPNLILSSEFLGANADLARLRLFADQLARRTRVIVYLRDQASLLLSRKSTHVRAGGTSFGAFDTILAGRLPPMLNFRRIIEDLERHFDRSAISVRLFGKDDLRGGSAVSDFLELVGVDEPGSYEIPRQNESLSEPAIELLRRINEHLGPASSNNQATRSNVLLDLQAMDNAGDFPRAMLTTEQAESLTSLTAESNDWVRQRYFPERAQLFAAEHETTGGTVDTSALLDHATRLLAGLYERHAAGQQDGNRP